jgi:hypothetical protein
MAGLINLKLLTDFFNKIGHERTMQQGYRLSVYPTRCLKSLFGILIVRYETVQDMRFKSLHCKRNFQFDAK